MKRIVLLTILLLCSACSSKKPIDPTDRFGKYNFSYDLAQRERTKLIQAFDDGKGTYLHFLNVENLKPLHIYPHNKNISLKYKIENNFVRVLGIYKALKIVSGRKISFLKRVSNIKEVER